MGNARSVSRRTALRLLGVGTATAGLATATGSGTESVRVNVGYANEAGREQTLEAASTVVREFPFDAVTVETTETEASELADDPDIRYVETDEQMQALGGPPARASGARVSSPDSDLRAQRRGRVTTGQRAGNVTTGQRAGNVTTGQRTGNVTTGQRTGNVATNQVVPYGVEQVNAPKAIEAEYTGEGAHVGVIDSGISPGHDDLQANIGEGAAIASCQTNCEYEWDDDNGHGTHVAGTIGARDNEIGVIGVAPAVTLHAVKVLGQYGYGTHSEIAAGITEVASWGWDVASMSLGGPAGSVVEEACELARSEGVLLVAAAGNAGPCTNCVSFPAAYKDTIAVSATSGNGSLWNHSSQGEQIELTAAGADLLSTYPTDDYRRLSGTSMACPHVSGVGASLMAAGLTADEARERMLATAQDLGLPPEQQGYGRVDAAAAFGL